MAPENPGNCHGKAIIRIQGCRVTAITGHLCNSRFGCSFILEGITYASGRTCRPMTTPKLLTPRQAAEKLGMGYPALKHWILAGRIKTIKTPGGHHRIPVQALEKFLPASQPSAGSARISGRNQLLGNVAEITIE